MGLGVDDNVYAPALSGTSLMAGGAFLDAGNKPNADSIACWGYVYQYVYVPLMTKNWVCMQKESAAHSHVRRFATAAH